MAETLRFMFRDGTTPGGRLNIVLLVHFAVASGLDIEHEIAVIRRTA